MGCVSKNVLERLTPSPKIKTSMSLTPFALRLCYTGVPIYKLRFQNMFEKFRYTRSVISCWNIRVHFTPTEKVGGTKG